MSGIDLFISFADSTRYRDGGRYGERPGLFAAVLFPFEVCDCDGT